MCTGACRLIFISMLTAWVAPALASAEPPDGNELVKATLLADTDAIEPGKPFRVGVHLKMDPHWHVYWINPGDSGVATSVEWKLPPGFTAGELQWPTPNKFDIPGGMVNYGYEDEVLLMATITPPEKIESQNIEIGADVSWLVCTAEQCLPGEASPSITLVRASPTSDMATTLFDRWRATLPQAESRDVKKIEKSNANEVVINWQEPVTEVEAFPMPADGVSSNAVEAVTKDDRTIVRVKEARPLKSVLGYTDSNGNRRGIALQFPR
jgi:thiol:disulfide interchange protein DsbD